MSHPHRFYAPFTDGEIAEVQLPPEEAHHALRVARLKSGDHVSVINGRGLELLGVLSARDRRNVAVEVQKCLRHEPPRFALTLALGGLHQDKAQQEVVRRAVETGFSRICFWHADHSQKPMASQNRWLKMAIETCKQCGRFYLPEIDTASSLEQFLGAFNGPGIIGLPELESDVPAALAVRDRLAVVVGPEGDFSPRERQVAENFNLTPINLGNCIYKSETAASFLMTLVAHQMGMLGQPLNLSLPSGKGGLEP